MWKESFCCRSKISNKESEHHVSKHESEGRSQQFQQQQGQRRRRRWQQQQQQQRNSLFSDLQELNEMNNVTPHHASNINMFLQNDRWKSLPDEIQNTKRQWTLIDFLNTQEHTDICWCSFFESTWCRHILAFPIACWTDTMVCANGPDKNTCGGYCYVSANSSPSGFLATSPNTLSSDRPFIYGTLISGKTDIKQTKSDSRQTHTENACSRIWPVVEILLRWISTTTIWYTLTLEHARARGMFRICFCDSWQTFKPVSYWGGGYSLINYRSQSYFCWMKF